MKHKKPANKPPGSEPQGPAAVGPETTDFPIIGIGASAGGLAAFEAFFSALPADRDPNMAFVLVQHLAPDHKSILCELIRRYTRMQVFEVEDGMPVRINCAYIIPPGRDMALLNGTLQLLEPLEPRGQRLPIDFFFRSLAQDQHERAIGIVLSGTGSDGTQGLRAIKGEGGMVMAQTPASTEFDGMPRSAIATGLMDYALPPAEMPARLLTYCAYAFGASGASGASGILGRPVKPGAVPSPDLENAMRKIFLLLRTRCGHDFSLYKPSTIHRRIERRMAVQQIESLDSFVKYLQQTPDEVEALFRDMLIGVTSFFRDPEAFQMLAEKAVPALLESRPEGSVLRVWTTACSTGEEAYSLAMLLVESMEARNQKHTLQVFATDIDRQAIATARAGIYPASIAADISPARLARFFTADPASSAYRINKSLRDMLVFSEQDVIKDPPFSKLDLISCRNLLIYLSAELQKKILPLFHYALNPGGVLFLGTSEGVGEFEALFEVIDRKSKLYRRKEDLHGLQRTALSKFLHPQPVVPALPAMPPRAPKPSFPVKHQLRELTEQALLQQVVPAGALVNSHGDILYLHGRTGMFLEPAPGEAGINNILKMAREGLRRELTTALHKASETKAIARSPGLRVKTNGHFTTVNLIVRPVIAGQTGPMDTPLFLVILDEVPDSEQPPAGTAKPAGPATPDTEERILALRLELQGKEDYLQSVNEELEASTEELKSSNEEMQSVNEELATVNTELQTKVVDLTRANNDMNNLLSGTGIGTVFVDFQLRILRFTPAASTIINLIPSDIGRPVGHLASNLKNYTTLLEDVRGVLNTLTPREIDVTTQEGKAYTLRIQPYRTLDNVIEGAVITFVEVTKLKQVEAELRQANEHLDRLAVVVRDAYDPVTVQDLDGRTLAWNDAAERMYGWTEAEALRMNVRERIPAAHQEEALAKIEALTRAELLEPYSTQRLTKDGGVVEVWITATALVNRSGKIYAISTTERSREGQKI